ncbi:DNA ligase D [Zunongwangia sp. F363]|uniref:DNA ligase (ATP) n=1 Tax=Autumnicola tepida TaxID=3075595 RepID=A0ABU3C580_9FLAO|nr:DNA ligase D [Zunongwangia sp. F363]MDT0641497.1 DNA ligase D [Zunongwangia sp. F363]
MSLEDYIRKRDFSKTPEPGGEISNENRGRFVIQRHKATRLHYDLRLEMDGVLKSWAVPKGPSMNPSDKRLAIQTEDHPIKYLNFHGTIPKGNYGAGEMSIWDEGEYVSAEAAGNKDLLEQLEKGNLKIKFSGKRVKGEFALVHTRRGEGNQWLLIKKKDDFSTDLVYDAEVYAPSEEKKKPKIRKLNPEDPVRPMLATATKEIFNDPGWIYELKWDGYRLIANIDNGNVRIHSRNGISYNSKFPNLVKDLEQIQQDVILDGEVVVLDKNGVPLFQELQNYDSSTKGALRFYVFDMLYLNGHSMLELPLLERKSLIPDVLEETSLSLYCDHMEGMGSAFYKKAVDAGMEGVIAKKADSTYAPGYRTEHWLKIKAMESQEAIICGYTESDKDSSVFRSLILGMLENNKLKYIGNCGTGFSHAEQKELLAQMKTLETEENPFEKKINLKGRKPVWVRPELICEIKFSEWTKSGNMRHPSYKGLRQDKNITEVHKEEKTATPGEASETEVGANQLEIGGIPVSFTNLEKIYWPESGFRKYDLVDYYLQVSEYMMPYLKDRPQNLHRHPNGIHHTGFYQKDNEGLLADWVETVKIYSKHNNRDIEYMLCQNEATLLYMANLGCIEINPWNSRVGNLENPDYTVIDIDPTDKNTFEEVIEVAQAVKEVLDKAKIEGFCKTSGSSGMHIYIPLDGEYSYEEARDFTKLLCYFVQEKTGKLTSMERAVKSRKGKIYLDFLQNRKGQTLAAPYCARPKKGATVSAPLRWEEVRKGLKISDFNIKNMPERIEKEGDLFTGVLGKGIDMGEVLERLNT